MGTEEAIHMQDINLNLVYAVKPAVIYFVTPVFSNVRIRFVVFKRSTDDKKL